MLNAVRRPRHGVEPFRLDQTTVDQAMPKCSGLDASERISDLLQNRCVEFRFCEVFALRFVGDARIARVRGGINQLLTRKGGIARDAIRQFGFELEETSLVNLNIHVSALVEIGAMSE